MRIPIATAIHLLLQDEVVAIPTETVYGLAALLSSPSAIATIFTLKQRPTNNPLIIHVANAAQCEQYAEDTPPGYAQLIEAFWPGPMTLVLPVQTALVPTTARAGLSTAAFRMPNHPIAREIIEQSGPLVAPSANLSGRPSATSPTHVEEDFGANFPVVDGGSTIGGLESTILAFNKEHAMWQLARKGALTSEQIEPVLGYGLVDCTLNQHPICPGQLLRHYAPKAKLCLTSEPRERYIVGFSDRQYPTAEKVFSLGASSSPHEVARNLYKVLRQLDTEQISTAAVDTNFPKNEGLWTTISERLAKAAQ